ncbi:hypothetical protein [Aeromonas veronii]|uniref:hypothetical protein n=1 Tax=Aeromonas veronii TaxID=654 RepID=UPI001BD0DC2D|nr:hypothetical protein [Aeromonas veronii]MBS4704325.1 hypothetical protein [Aeromonas veronii]
MARVIQRLIDLDSISVDTSSPSARHLSFPELVIIPARCQMVLRQRCLPYSLICSAITAGEGRYCNLMEGRRGGLPSTANVMQIIYSGFAHCLLKNEFGVYQFRLSELFLSVLAFFWLFIHPLG